jgi:uncharacterized protein (DUF983 family)
MAHPKETISLSQAMWRGFRCRCPNCGKGHVFGKFLKVADHCEVCGEEFHHHRADDFPAYLVIIVVGHVIVPLILAVETAYAPPYWLQFLIWLPLTFVSALGLLQPTKGAIVGLQWQTGMHGFEAARKRREACQHGRHSESAGVQSIQFSKLPLVAAVHADHPTGQGI